MIDESATTASQQDTNLNTNNDAKVRATDWRIGLGLFVATIAGGTCYQFGLSQDAIVTAAITALCAAWWVTEAIPLPVTALIPLSLFPLLGVLEPNVVAQAYGHPLILFFLGGFIMSAAMEKSGAHRRLALGIVKGVGGTSVRRLVFGFMLASAFLSMFISNTAALLMLLPIMMATIEGVEDKQLRIILLLAVAYAASIGGIGTPIGTPPNLLFIQSYEQATGAHISFLNWMLIAIPIVAVMLVITCFWLTRNLKKAHGIQLPHVGSWTSPERRTLAIFFVTAMLWITRTAPFGGWSEMLSLPWASDANIALLAVIAMFLMPNGDGGKILDWESARTIPWGMLLLFAGGIAIAKAFEASGLGLAIGNSIASFNTFSLPVLILVICFTVIFLTELTSNTATAALLMPLLANAAIVGGFDPLLIMLPAVYAISFAFMLPVATPTNAVVYGTKHIPISRMVREGVFLNFAGIAVISVMLTAANALKLF